MNRVAASLAMAAGLFAGSASAELPANALDMSGITDMTTLPTEGLKIIATDRGMIAVTSNGRWVIKGTVYDTWQMRAVRSVADVRESANKIDLERLKVDIDGLEPLYVGTPGKPEVVAYIDPYCDACTALVRQMQAIGDEYRFKLLLIGVATKESADLVRTLGCSPDDAAERALVTGDYSGLKPDPDCDLDPMRRTLITAQLFGVDALPFLIAPDGRIRKSAPQDLSGWLEAES